MPVAPSVIPAPTRSVRRRSGRKHSWSCALLLVHATACCFAASAAPDASALRDAAATALAAGRHAQAAALAQRAAADTAAAPALRTAAQALAGQALLLDGRRDEAQQALEAALAGAAAQDDVALAARIHNDLGLLHGARQDHAAALAAFAAAQDAARRAGVPALAWRALVNEARTLAQAGRLAEAVQELRAARPALLALPASADTAALLTSAGHLLAPPAGGDPALAAELLAAAAQAAAAVGDARGQSWALGYASEVHAATGRAADALTLARQAIHQAQLAGAADSLYRWQWQTGRLLRAEGDLAGATDALLGAVRTLEGVRADLAARERAAGATDGFRHGAGPLYVELVDVLLARARLAPPDARDPLLHTARDTMESLKGAELEDYFQDDCVAGLKSKTVGVDALAPRTAALYPILLRDRLALLVSMQDGLRLFETPVRAAQVERETARLRARLEKRSTYQYLPHAQRLYDWIMRPLDATLRDAGVDTLVFVPDGRLRTIPLAALHDGGAFVIERYAVATVPGLTLTDPRPLTTAASSALVSGLTQAVQGFAALPAVGVELEGIAKIFPGTVLKDEAFSNSSFATALDAREYSVVHIASHGQFGGNIDDTFLLTHDGRIAMNDLESHIGRTATRGQPVELLTLSACQTAAGDERAALGLAGVAVKAGARSALATLWSVNDRASAALVARFYEGLQGGAASKVAALRDAQLALLREARYRHPAYWSPFLMIGNWL